MLDAAEDRKHLAAGATVLGAELAGEALAVAEAPSRLRSTAHPHGVQIGRVSQSWERLGGGSRLGLL